VRAADLPDRIPDRIADRALAAPARLGRVRLVAVDGPSGSGKSVFADGLLDALRERVATVALVRTDDIATWDDPVSWWPALADGVLTPLAEGRPGGYRRTAWTADGPVPGDTVEVAVPEVLVVEGVSSARRSVRPRLSLCVWIEVADPAVRLARAVGRDGPDAMSHLRRWQLFENGWFAVDRPDSAADLVVDGSSPMGRMSEFRHLL